MDKNFEVNRKATYEEWTKIESIVRNIWNHLADEYNQWDSLGQDEIIDLLKIAIGSEMKTTLTGLYEKIDRHSESFTIKCNRCGEENNQGFYFCDESPSVKGRLIIYCKRCGNKEEYPKTEVIDGRSDRTKIFMDLKRRYHYLMDKHSYEQISSHDMDKPIQKDLKEE
jgi:ribosomal protein L37E